MRVFIGYDKNETVAFHVLAYSIMRQSSIPVSITPLILDQLPLTRPRDVNQSTDFSFSRFLVPYLCDYKGRAVFMDCDMLFRMDIKDLWKQTSDKDAAVSVVKHNYIPKAGNKFLDQRQSVYEKKNWSSLMLFNNEKCQSLTKKVVNDETGMYLHQFHWTDDVGELPLAYNHLVGEYKPNPDAKIVHFTLGTPCFAKYADCEFAQEWRDEKALMTSYNKIGEYKEREAA
jgi:lipopolysaccharide biosynthesis glycosyltransferase